MNNGIQQLFDAKHSLSREAIAELTDAQIHTLAEMVRGARPTPDVTVPMQVLTKAAPETARSAIRYLLERKNLPGPVRALGIIQMARLDGPEVEETIINNLELDGSLLVATKVAAALGRIGTERSLAPLKRLSKTEGAVGRQARLAMMLVGARMRSDEYMPQPPGRERLFRPDRDARQFRMHPAAKTTTARAIADIEGDTFGVHPSDQATTIECGRALSILLFDRELVDADTVAALAEVPRVAGLIAYRAPVDGSYSTRYVLASWPDRRRKRVHLTGYRTDGIQYLYGTLEEMTGTGGRFSLSGVRDGVSLALQVEGHIENREFFFDELLCAEHVTGKKRLQPVDPTLLTPRAP